MKVTGVVFFAALTLLLIAGIWGTRKAQARRDWAAANGERTSGAADRTVVTDTPHCNEIATAGLLKTFHAKLHDLGFARVECADGTAGEQVP